jgi:hypothetical protein
MRDKYAEICDLLPRRLIDRHRIGRRGRLETDGKKDNLFIRVRLRDPECIQRRVHHTHVAPACLDTEQIAGRAGDTQHVAK